MQSASQCKRCFTPTDDEDGYEYVCACCHEQFCEYCIDCLCMDCGCCSVCETGEATLYINAICNGCSNK